jgi:protein-tyrosine phosphatase
LNVEPYAQNRIKLRLPDGFNDYINASPIQLGERKYIATQGPKDTSVNHFYRMLEAEVQSPAVVVMLTQTHEAGREKCAQYYPLDAEESPMSIPEDNETRDGWKGEVHLESVEEGVASRSQIRRLRLRTWYQKEESEGESEVKEVEMVHLLFSGWPDFLIPEGEDRTALVELIRLSASLNSPPSPEAQTNGATNGTHSPSALATSSNPRIIHCSAGVGRSGTFIALDYLLTQLHSGAFSTENLDPPDRDPIADTVDLLRQQRMMMVQGEGQFGFLYDVLRECYVTMMQEQDAAGGATADGESNA